MLIRIQSEIPKCRKSKIFDHARKSPCDLPTFKCNACGSCCSHIRGIAPKEDREFLREHAFGKMPVVQLVPVEQITFPLWDWEAKRFMEWQHEADVDAKIKPLRAIMDLNSNKAIILTYFMDSINDACPFLKNNKCSIYRTKRAYVCRLFPFNRGPFLDQKGMQLKDMFGECGAMEHILSQVPDEFGMSEIARGITSNAPSQSKTASDMSEREHLASSRMSHEHAQKPSNASERSELAHNSLVFDEMIKFLYKAFPDGSFLNAVQNDIVIEWANKTIVDLMRKNIVNPAMNQPYKFLLKRISNTEKIDFMDFLAETGYLTETEKENLIKRFDDNIDAMEKISHFLN